VTFPSCVQYLFVVRVHAVIAVLVTMDPSGVLRSRYKTPLPYCSNEWRAIRMISYITVLQYLLLTGCMLTTCGEKRQGAPEPLIGC
jgi:hypothetical protein